MVSFGGATSSSLLGVGNGIRGVSAALWGDLALRCSGTVVSLSIRVGIGVGVAAMSPL